MDTSSTKYGKLSSTVTPNGGAGIRGREVMDKLLARDLHNRIIDESSITQSPYLFKRLIQAWSKSHKLELRKFVYVYPHDRTHPWVPIPPANTSLAMDLPLFGKNGWCMEALSHPRAGDDIDGPMETGRVSRFGAVNAQPEIGAESLTTEEAKRLEAIRAVLSAGQIETEVIGGEVSGDDEDNDSDHEPASSDSEIRDPTYVPSVVSSLTSSTSSLHSPPASIETQYARLFNAIATVMSTSFGITTQQDPSYPSSGQRRFCSTFSTLPIPESSFKRKPDGVLVDGNITPSRTTWRKVIAVLEYTEQDFTLSASIVRQMHMKSYLILRRQPWRTFVLGISLSKQDLRLHYYDRSGTIISRPIEIQVHPTKLIDIIATLAYGDRTRLGYDPTIYVNEDVLDQQRLITSLPPTARNTLAMDQNLPPASEPGRNAQTIGWVIIPGGQRFDILGIVWSSDGMVGRGTTCYHVRDPVTLQEFALKDYWVDGSSIHHETEMLDMLKEIPGVPKVAHAWTVGEEGATGNKDQFNFAQNTVDIRRSYGPVLSQQTLLAIGNCRVHRRILMTPFASPIYAFASLEELVWSFLTISETHTLMTDAGVLHQDVSINNLMIAPDSIHLPPVTPSPPSSIGGVESTPIVGIVAELGKDQPRRGWIVDLDYAKLLSTSTSTSVGTGTLPFLSCRILNIMEENSRNPNNRLAIEQNAEDDMESLFYVLVWICCLYEGPNNSPRRDRPFKGTFCYNWAERSFEQDFVVPTLAKLTFINRPVDDFMLNDLHPYFTPIFGLLQKWRNMIQQAYKDRIQVSSAEVHKLLLEAYKELCSEGAVGTPVVSTFRKVKKRRVEELMN